MSMCMIGHLSHSQIAGFVACPRRWHFDKIEGAPRERTPAALAFGSAIHDAVAAVNEAAMAGGGVDARSVFTRKWRAAVDEPVAPIHFGRDDGDDLLAKGLAIIDAYRAPEGIIGVEQPFEVMLADNLPPVVGRIDLIRQAEDGIVLADVKTSATRTLTDTATVEAQLGLYDIAYPAARHEVIVISKTKQPVITSQSITPMPKESLIKHYREVFAAMSAGVRFAVRGWHCESCAFRDRCQREILSEQSGKSRIASTAMQAGGPGQVRES